jgi:hypothetical protein
MILMAEQARLRGQKRGQVQELRLRLRAKHCVCR